MNAYLQAIGWVYPLSPKVTTIGRSGCDIIINNASVDEQHAVIERDENQSAHILRDLCSEKGTFVNNISIRNASVILKQGDQIRFGSAPTVYGFERETKVESSSQNGLAQLRSAFVTSKSSVPLWVQSHETVLREGKTQLIDNSEINNQGVSGKQNKSAEQENKSRSTKNPERSTLKDQEMMEKEAKIQRLQQELNRLASLEVISAQKDILIRQLQEELVQRAKNGVQYPLSQSRKPSIIPPLLPGSNSNAFTNQTDEKIANTSTPPKAALPTASPTKARSETSSASTSPPNEESDKCALDRIRRERNILSGLVTQLQCDLSRKDENIARLLQEAKDLRNRLDEKDAALAAAHAKIASATDNAERAREQEAYEKTMTTLRQKYKSSEFRCDALQAELEKLQLNCEQAQKSVEEKARSETNLRGQMEELKTKMIELERSERNALLEKQEKQDNYNRLRNRIKRAVFAVRLNPSPKRIPNEPPSSDLQADCRTEAGLDGVSLDSFLLEDWENPAGLDRSNNALAEDMDDNHIVDRVQHLIDHMLQLRRHLSSEAEQKRIHQKRERSIEVELDVFVQLLTDFHETPTASNKQRASARIKHHLDKLATHSTPFTCLRRLQNALVEDLQQQLTTAQQIENCLQETVSTLANVQCNLELKLDGNLDDLVPIIQQLTEHGRSAQVDRDKLRKRLIECEFSHREELERLEQSIRGDLQQKLAEALAQNNEEHAEKHRRALEEVVQIETNRHEQMLVVKAAIIGELEHKLREVELLLSEQQAKYETELQDLLLKCTNLEEYQNQLSGKDAEITTLRNQLEQVKISTEKATEAACEERWSSEVASHREQAKQHARTICVLEDRMVKLAKQMKDAKAEIQRLKRQNSELQAEHKLLQGRFSETQQRLSSAKRKSPGEYAERRQQTITDGGSNIEKKEMEFMGSEISRLNQQLEDRETIIESLRADLRGARAQLSDLRGELTEAQKEEIESALEYGKRVNAELVNTQTKLAQQEQTIQGLREQTAEKDTAVKKHVAAIEELSKTLTAQEEEIARLTQLIEREKDENLKIFPELHSNKGVTEDLAALGGECRGERHREIIEKQRAALCQLRQQLQEQCHIARAGDQQLEQPRQLTSLRREIAELRSQQIISEVLPSLHGPQSQRVLALGKGSSQPDEGYSTCRCERPKFDTATEVLHASEENYLDLVKTIAEQLNLGTLPGQRSLTYVPAVERDMVKRERRQAIDLMSQRIAALQEQVHRKEQLLANYERDMCKLKQAEALVAVKGEQIEQMFINLRSKENEIQLLRHALNQTREELTEEKRLLSAVKKGRVSKSARAVSSAARRKETHGSPQGLSGSDQRKKKEQMTNKEYVAKVLKNERCSTERRKSDGTDELNRIKATLNLTTEAL